jgi:hypothetical protein
MLTDTTLDKPPRIPWPNQALPAPFHSSAEQAAHNRSPGEDSRW